MIKKLTSTIFLNIALLTVVVGSSVKLFQHVKYLTVGRGLHFGYDVTIAWDVLVVVYWLLWLFGGSGYYFKKKWSYVLLYPASILSIIAIIFSIQRVIYKGLDEQLFYYGGLVCSLVILLNLFWRRREIRLSAFHYLFGALVLVAMSILFMTVSKRGI